MNESKRFVSEYVEIIDENGSRQAVCVTDKEHTVSFEVKDEYVAMDLCEKLNGLSDTVEALILDRNKQEEKLDIARINMTKQLEKIDEQQATIKQQEQSIKILKQEIADAQAILEMLNEKLKGWNNE